MAKAYSSFVSTELFTMVGPVRVRDSYREEGWYIFIFVCSTFLKGEKGSENLLEIFIKILRPKYCNLIFFNWVQTNMKFYHSSSLYLACALRTCPTQVKSFVLTKELKRRIYFGNLGVINLWWKRRKFVY